MVGVKWCNNNDVRPTTGFHMAQLVMLRHGLHCAMVAQLYCSSDCMEVGWRLTVSSGDYWCSVSIGG